MKFTDKLNALIKDKGLNRRKFSIASGIPYGTIDNWYKRSYENMAISTFKTLCAFFGVTMESMAYDDREIEYSRDASRDTPTRREYAHLDKYRALDDDGRQMVDTVLDTAFWQATRENTAQDATRESA